MKRLLLILFVLSISSTVCAGTLLKRPVYGTGYGYTYSETVGDGLTSNALVIPPLEVGSKPVTVTMINGANTGKMQFTTSSDILIAADTAIWQDWPLGAITGTDSDALIGSVTALRGVSASGEVKYEVVY